MHLHNFILTSTKANGQIKDTKKMLLCLLLVCISLASRIQAHSPEIKLITKLNQFYCFDHNLILLESTTILDQFVNTPRSSSSYVPQTLQVIEDITGEINTKSFRRSANAFMIIGFRSTNIERNLIFLTKIKDFQRVNIDLKIGLFVMQPLPNGYDYVLQLFKWCWVNSIVNIFIGYRSGAAQQGNEENISKYFLNVYTFNPYGTFELINLTDNQASAENYFPRICYDLQQHPIRIAAYDDINSLIYSKDNPKFGGVDGKLWQTIFYAVNASYKMVTFFEVTDGHIIQEMATNGTIDLGPQAYLLSGVKSIYLYPIYMDNVAIIVPKAEPYAEFIAYLQTFLDDNNSFNVSLLTILAVIVVLTFTRYMKRKRIFLFQSVADVVNLFMYDNLAIDYRNLYRAESFLILPLTLAGFVIINVLLSILTSYLTRPMDQPEINSFADIEQSPFPILVPTKKNMDQLIEKMIRTWNIDWAHKMIYSNNLDEFFQRILSFNTSICFVYFGSKVKNLIEYQKRLNIRGFRIPTQTVSQTAFGYIVKEDFPLKDCFNEIIQWIMSAGLYWKWADESYFEFVEKGFFSETLVNEAEGGAEKYYIPIFIVYGWIGSALVFSLELVWSRIKVFKKNLSKKRSV